MTEPYYRFNHIAKAIERLLAEEGVYGEVDIDVDQYNNTIKLYYESTEVWDAGTQQWRVWDEDENRWLD